MSFPIYGLGGKADIALMEQLGKMSSRCCLIVLAIGCMVACIACSPESYSPIQPNQPNSNSAIVDQYIFGSDAEKTTIWYVCVDTDGSTFCAGLYEGRSCIWKVAASGDIEWSLFPEMRITDIDFIEVPFEGNERCLISVGSVDTDGDGGFNEGLILILDVTGSVVIEERVVVESYMTRAYKVVPIGHGDALSAILISGSILSDVRYPYMGIYELHGDSTVTCRQDTVLWNRSGCACGEAAWNGNIDDPRYFMEISPVDADFSSVYCYDSILALQWEQSVQPSKVREFWELLYHQNSIFVAGYVSESEDSWKSGLIASIDESGILNWSGTYSISEYGDIYYGCAVEGTTLYAAGICSSFEWSADTRVYGCALLSAIDIGTGEVVCHSSFGDPRYKSLFNEIRVHEGRASCGGCVCGPIEDLWFQGWLADIDIEALQADLADLQVTDLGASSTFRVAPNELPKP